MEHGVEPADDNPPIKRQVGLVRDGEGLAVIGKPKAVKRFLKELGLYDESVDIGDMVRSAARTGADVAETAAKLSEHSGRWLKMTAETAAKVQVYGLTDTKLPGISWGMIGERGDIKEWLQLETGLGSKLTNPATLTDVASLLGKLASQQEQDELKAFLERLERKTDKIIRNQNAAVWSQLAGAHDVLARAGRVLETEDSVDPTIWSTVHGELGTIYRVQRYTLDQLRDLAKETETTTNPRALARALEEAEPHVRECLSVLAHSFDLNRAFDELELDRIRQESPDRYAQRRRTLEAVREERREIFAQAAAQLMGRLQTAADQANLKALLHRPSNRRSIASINEVTRSLDELHEVMGIEPGSYEVEAIQWWEALRSSEHLGDAAKEVGKNTLMGVATAVVAIGIPVAVQALTGDKEDESEG